MRTVKKRPTINKASSKQSLFPEIIFDENGVFRKEEDKETGKIEYIKVANYIDIKEQSLNLETNEHEIIVEYLAPGQVLKEITVLGDEISSLQKIEALARYGVNVHPYNKSEVLKHLENRKAQVKCLNKHSDLGFVHSDTNTFFKHYQLLDLNQGIHSTYNGPLNIQPKGSYSEWNHMIKEEVQGHTPLELAVVMGLASATIGFISKDLSVENLVVNLVNDSSTGKTTACQLAASVFGSPILKDNGLVMSWNSTFNALQNKLAGNTGVVVIFDEASMARNDDFTKAIYSLAEGKETSRMDKNLIVKKSKVWNTLIISTGEKSLFEASNNNSGLKVRLIELADIVWTKSAEHSEKIKYIVMQNYGFSGQMYANELMKRGKEQIIQMFYHWKSEIVGNLSKGAFSDRIALKLAVLMLTAEIANDLFGWNFNLNEIGALLIENENEKLQESDLGEKALERLLTYISAKMDHFDIDWQNGVADYSAATRDLWGKIIHTSVKDSHKFKQPLKEIVINYEIISKILKELKYESPQTIIRQWKKKGWLSHEKGKNYRKRNLNGTVATCLVFDFNQIPTSDEEVDLNQLLSNGQVEKILKQNRALKGDFSFRTSKEIKQQIKKQRQLDQAKQRLEEKLVG